MFTNDPLSITTQISRINAVRILLLSGLSSDYSDNSNFGRQIPLMPETVARSFPTRSPPKRLARRAIVKPCAGYHNTGKAVTTIPRASASSDRVIPAGSSHCCLAHVWIRALEFHEQKPHRCALSLSLSLSLSSIYFDKLSREIINDEPDNQRTN